MAIPRRYTDEDIRLYYEEFRRRKELEGITLKDFCAEKGLPYDTIYKRFKRLERELSRAQPSGPRAFLSLGRESPSMQTAEDEVAATVQRAIAQESKTTTTLYLALGKKIWDAFAHYASKRGWDLSKIKDLPIDQYVLEALRKADDFDKLVEDYGRLATEYEYLKSRVDPLVRFENAMELLASFAELNALFYLLFGVDLAGTEFGWWFAGLIEDYLMGKYPKVFRVGY